NLEVTTKSIKEETSTYAITIDYPQFGAPVIDDEIRKDISDAIVDFKTFIDESQGSDEPQNTLDGKYDSVYVGPDVVSAKLLFSQYTGGAHELPLLSGINFDRSTGKRLLLDDVLPMIGKATTEVSAE